MSQESSTQLQATSRRILTDLQDDLSDVWLCGRAVHALLARQLEHSLNRTGDARLIDRRLDDLLSLAHGKFYAYPFSDVPLCWLALFTDASIIKACRLASESVGDMVKVLDTALILTGARRGGRHVWICELLEELERLLPTPEVAGILDESATLLQIQRPARRMENCSLEDFVANMASPRDVTAGPEPLFIAGGVQHWPALHDRPWKSIRYLLTKTIGGRRLIPIEVGRTYVDDDWTQKIVTFNEFLNDHLVGGHQVRTGYLAQYGIFDQIPSLRNDISVPDYCYMVPSKPHHSSPLAQTHLAAPTLEGVAINAWLGPRGTISPLHLDQYHNVLAQVVGCKYVRLYPPKDSDKLYPRGSEGGIDMTNNSQVDVGVLEGWDGTGADRINAHARFPRYAEASYVECILEPGDCLYIPVGWWHYVRSLSASFSVNFWWNNWC